MLLYIQTLISIVNLIAYKAIHRYLLN